MQIKFKNYVKEDVEPFLVGLKEQIRLGYFDVERTEKNEKTKREFRLNKSKIQEMLLSLSVEDFKYKLPDLNMELDYYRSIKRNLV